MMVVVAAAPVLLVFGAIASQRVAAWKAAVAGAALAFALAVTAWRLSWPAALSAVAYGLATGIFPIVYIIWGSLLLYNLTVVTGWAERLRTSLAHLAGDHDLLLLLVGFGFAAFLDSTAGFLTPVTVGTILLTGLGVPALTAAAYTLVSTSLLPAFGAMGIPVLVMADVGQVPVHALAHMQAAVSALLFVLFPAWLTVSFGGWRALRRLWLPALASGIAYAAALWWTVTCISFYLAGLAAALAALVTIGVTGLRGGTRRSSASGLLPGGLREAVAPWWPYWVLMGAVVLWSLPVIAHVLDRWTVHVPMPALPGVAWRLDLLASPATAILVATALAAIVGRASLPQVVETIRRSSAQVRYPLANILAMFALAQVMNVSGMTRTLGLAVAGTHGAFPLVSPYLSWLGAAITGSNTASNALLGRLQSVTAAHLGFDPLLALALAGAASPLGKMIAPQVIAAAVAAARLRGAEGRLLRIGLLHSVIWLTVIGIVGLLLTR